MDLFPSLIWFAQVRWVEVVDGRETWLVPVVLASIELPFQLRRIRPDVGNHFSQLCRPTDDSVRDEFQGCEMAPPVPLPMRPRSLVEDHIATRVVSSLNVHGLIPDHNHALRIFYFQSGHAL